MTTGNKTIRIGKRLVGDGQPCFIVAEAGVNHNGDPEIATRLLDVAHRAGVDAFKLQKRSVSDILIKAVLDAPDLRPTALGPTYGAHRERLELPHEAWRALAARASTLGVELFASAWDERSADFLESLGVPAYKIASADVTNLPLIEHVAKKRRPMLLSTGMSDFDEVKDAVARVTRHHDELILLQCTSTYPAEHDEIDLAAMAWLRAELGCLVGYSGHERGLAPSEAAVALGACVIERHMTLDRTMLGPDHAASLEPRGVELLVRNIRTIEAAMGKPRKALRDRERATRVRLAKSVAAARAIARGATITRDDLCIKGPGDGIAPKHVDALVGAIAQADVGADTLLPLEALAWPRR